MEEVVEEGAVLQQQALWGPWVCWAATPHHHQQQAQQELQVQAALQAEVHCHLQEAATPLGSRLAL
jgi:hypothetical protein